MRTPSQRSIGGKRGPRERPLEEPYFGEPGPIVFPKGIGRVEARGLEPIEDVDPIVWPPSGQPAAYTEVEPELEYPPRRQASARAAAAPSRLGSLMPGLLVGCLLGAAVGGVVASRFTGSDRQPPAPEASAPMAQSMTVEPALRPAKPDEPAAPPTVSAEPSPLPRPPTPGPAVKAPAAEAQPETGGLDLDRLARALGLSAQRPPARVAQAPPAPAQTPVIAAAPAEPLPPLRSTTIDPPRPVEAPKLVPPPTIAAPAPAARGPTQRPSFDCGSATSATQQLICADADLALADRRLSLAYDAAMASSFDRLALREDQQRWARDRDRLGADPAAVAAFYQSRMTELDVQTRVDRRRGGLLRKR